MQINSHHILLIYHSKDKRDFYWYPRLYLGSTPVWYGIDLSWCGFYLELGIWR